MSKLRVAIIGAGASGLPAIKCCLDDGLEPVCFERSSDIGGLWNYENSLKEGEERQPCVMKSTIINTCKEMMCYSDFPIPAEYPAFMHNTYVQKYLRLYAENFKLLPYIQLKTEVIRVSQTEDFATSGRWQIKHRNLTTGKEETEVFDAVLVCSGHHADKYMPHFEGQEKFKGQIVHTHDFHDGILYSGKRVVIIGMGNSAGDVAVELSRIAKQVYLSTRRGAWISNRITEKGVPLDYNFNRRVNFALFNILPRSLVNWYIESKLNQRFDHALYGVKPEHRFDEQHITINDELPNHIANGFVVVKPDVKRFTETSVVFDDGSVVEDVDAIIVGTGYKFGFPFIDHPALEVKNNRVQLFKFCFPPDLRPSTIAVIGFFQPIGAIFPISELQIRWAIRVFKGERPLPPSQEMWKDIRHKEEQMAKRYVASPRHTIQVDYPPFMDELAELVDCKPDLCNMLLTDPLLACKLFFDAMTPYQFRLQGHGAWPGARQAIMTQWDRLVIPFKHQSRKVRESDNSTLIKIILIAVIVFILARLLF